MNPTDSTVESIEAGRAVAGGDDPSQPNRRGRLAGVSAAGYNASRSSLVKTFDDWLKTQDVTFIITFDRYSSDTARAMAYAISH